MDSSSEFNYTSKIAKGVHLVDFYADWCGPCRVMSPILESLEKETEIKIHKVNVDHEQRLSAKQGIQSIPTIIVYKDGVEKGRIIGAVSLESLKQSVKDLIK